MKRIVFQYDMFSGYEEVGTGPGQIPWSSLHDASPHVSGLVPEDVWAEYLRAVEHLHRAKEAIRGHYDRHDLLTDDERAIVDEQRALILTEDQKVERDLKIIRESCDHVDDWETLFMDGQCMVCGAVAP